MRKIVLTLAILFITSNLYAGILSNPAALSGDAGVTYNWLNDLRNNTYNEINGNIEGSNIASNTISDDNMVAALKMENWYDESFGSWTYSGHLPATSTDLTSDISAGTSYVEGKRVTTAATSHTYTASKDTWVYIDYNGAFQYEVVANDASQPTTPANSLLLATVVTDATKIASVTDLRQTTPTGLRVYVDHKNGLVISRDTSDVDAITIGRGEIEFGSAVSNGRRRNTSATTVNFATTGRGGLDTGSLAEGYYYIHAVADDDTSTAYEGIASTSSTDASGVTGERLVGWCYAPDTNTISPDSVGAYRARGGDAYNNVTRVISNDIATTSTAFTTMETVKFYSSGRPVETTFSAPVTASNNAADIVAAIYIDNIEKTSAKVKCPSADVPTTLYVRDVSNISAGTHDISIKWKTGAGGYTIRQRGSADGPRVITVEEK